MSHLAQLIEEEDRALARRLLAEQGVAPGALLVAQADLEAIVSRARRHGVTLATAMLADWRHCRVCGCSEILACRPEPCGWAGPEICTACAPHLGEGHW